MTAAKRRLLIRLSWVFVYNVFTPFMFGALLSFFLTSSAVLDAFQSYDRSGLGVCKISTKDGQQ